MRAHLMPVELSMQDRAGRSRDARWRAIAGGDEGERRVRVCATQPMVSCHVSSASGVCTCVYQYSAVSSLGTQQSRSSRRGERQKILIERLKSRKQRLYRTAVMLGALSGRERATQPTTLRYTTMHPDSRYPRTRVSDPSYPQISSNFNLDHRIAFSPPSSASWQAARHMCSHLYHRLQARQDDDQPRSRKPRVFVLQGR